jgi:hypothetical protein
LENPPARFLVTGEPTEANILGLSLGQLVRIEGSWS